MAKRRSQKSKKTWYPCVVKELQPHDPEFQKGARFRVHNFDDGRMHFVTRERMIEVLDIHAMMPVTPEKMDELRRQEQREFVQ